MTNISIAARKHDAEPTRIKQLQLPERAPIASGVSARQADLKLLATAPAHYLDTTHFDTVRFPPPAWALEQFAKAAQDGSLAYTGYRGHRNVLAAVAESVAAFLGMPVDPERNIIFTPGTQAGLFTALAALVEAGDRVALLDPDYLFSARILRFLDAEIGYVPLRQTRDGPTPDLAMLEEQFAKYGARHFVFSHPNNPTGAVFSSEVISSIAKLTERYDVTVLADELYARLLHDGRPFPHLATFPEMVERVVTLLGPSKTESMSGYRLGVVVGPPRLMERIEHVLSITSLRAPAYAQHVLAPWLRDDHAWVADRLRDFGKLRDMTVKHLRRLPWLKLEPQAGTAYLWPDVSALNLPATTVAGELLREAAVLVSPGYQFGPTAGGHFRICYARDEIEWTDALERMVSVLDRLALNGGLPKKTA